MHLKIIVQHTIQLITKNISNMLKVNLANLKILRWIQLEAYYLSSNSVLVVKETVKFYINQSNLKKASEVINKTWRKLLCIIN